MLKKILIGLLILLIIGQFFQPSRNNGNADGPTDITHVVTVPDTVMALLKTSCYDCHSNHTSYPWYNNITPVNWWLKSHIDDGKHDLNFSEFASYNARRKGKKLEGISEEVEKHDMPLKSYLLIHTNAKLNDAQRKMVMDWTQTARKQVLQDSLAGRR